MEYSFAARHSRAFSVLAATIVAIAAVVPIAAKKSAPGTQAKGEIVATGTMGTRRSGHTATPLHNGDVLITGGMVERRICRRGRTLRSYYRQIPAAGRMASPRVGHTATLLPDGRVLIVGGSARPYQDVAQAEIYDPATRRFEATGSLIAARSDPKLCCCVMARCS